MIPKIIHQTWKTKEIPVIWKPYQESWIELHPAWEYRLWTDEENMALVQGEYPQYLEFYRALPYSILRVEFVKLLYLHKFGGLYVDLDFEALKPLDPLFGEPCIVLGQESEGLGHYLRRDDYFLNALIASPAQHPFWDELLNRVVTRFRKKRFLEFQEWYVIRMVIELLDELAREYRQSHSDLIVHPADVFYPAKPLDRDPDYRLHIARQKDSYAVHHYGDTWFTPGMKCITAVRYLWHRYVLRRM